VSKLGIIVGLTAMLVAALTAGCGGSSSSSSSETTATGTTATTGANERLTTAQWEEYETSRAALRKANATATATLKKCPATTSFGDSAALQSCVGDTFTELSAAADSSLTTLEGFQGTVSGPCAEALDNLANYVGTFRNAASKMQKTIDTANLAAYPAASQDLQVSQDAGRNEATTFEKDCAPA
jgi:hypothetical protein